MSSLTLIPCGETFDYWWERLRGRTHRRRFLLTKVVEVLAYKQGRMHKRTENLKPFKSLLEMEPRIELNNIADNASVAVVIPARCEDTEDTRIFARCLDALIAQDAIIIAVNDGSKEWPDLPSDIRVIRHEQSRGPAAARNTATQEALNIGADLVLYTDSDCIPGPDWVYEAKSGFIANPYIHIQSGNTVAAGTTWFDTYHNINGTLNGRRVQGSDALFYGPTCNLAVSRVLAKRIAFDESFPNAACEDIEYCLRALEAGYRITHNSGMRVRHDFQYRRKTFWRNLSRFRRQFRRYASAEAALVAKSEAYYGFFGQTVEIPALVSKVHSATFEAYDRTQKGFS